MEEIANQERRFEAFKKELEDKQRRLVRFENVQELMKQYKKPLLQSAFDLQSRLANQIKTNFLYQFAQKGNARDRDYARLNMAFVISEFLGWLEVIRQEIVFIVGGGNRTSDLNLILDAIKFQFTGETPVQGNGSPHSLDTDVHWQTLQLYAGELRAIGEVMIVERTYDDDNVGSNLSVIGYAEFVRRCNAEPPGLDSPEELAAWKAGKEKLQQETLAPLLGHVDKLMTLENDSAPRRRITMLQVLLCKLIDVLDDAVPYEMGPEFNLEDGEEPRYIPRDFRLTPLVKWLSRPQLKWLSEQRFMEKVHAVDRLAWTDWHARVRSLPPEDQDIFVRVAFPGFREDLHVDRDGRMLSQEEREKKLGKDAFPAAFPPRQPRMREPWWWAALSPTDHERWYNEAVSKGRVAAGTTFNKSASMRRGQGSVKSGGFLGISWPLMRNRKTAPLETKAAPPPDTELSGGYATRAVLTSPSAQTIRFANSGVPSPQASRDMTPVQVNPRSSAGL
ncbi:hypothetical protein GPECTOR_11g57 [Gonium pectorale]|uniref:Uncharacterized protein n=1 Tax=Gonium pectorale TaxID=33097 RepID=A0A150GQ47_GONPE|nr:hypothetical protein GPECTOR_11g57 [Gonium pectorale]|eukprot:KXZ51931.1 hypothetical protein GPECTOR_11g57 [Gonium pectorale]